MKIVLLFFMLMSSLLCSALEKPKQQYKASGGVTDFVVQDDSLYVATQASCIDIFDLKSAQKLKVIKLPKIEDFMHRSINSKVYSVDILGDKIVLLSQANRGFRRVHIYENENLELIISNKEELYISEVRFLDAKTLLFGLLSSELISYDIDRQKINWRIQVSHSKFSDLVLNEQKDEIIVADESGDLKRVSAKDGSLIETLSGENLDNVFQVDYKHGIIATAGQDRRVVVYDVENFLAYYKQAPFLIYSVGVSPNGKRVAYASDEENNVEVFEVKSKKVLGKFTGNKMTLTKILFLNEKEFLVASDAKIVNRYIINKE
jgi:WD40 repeat protein